MRLRPTPVKAAALELGLPVFEPTCLRSFAAQIAGEGYQLFVVASYGRILPQALLDVPALGALNVHPSLLPRYRGATPLQSALRDGARETGVTIMLMDAGTDTGDIVLQERTPIADDEIYGQLHDRLAQLGAHALCRAIALAATGVLPRTPQRGEATLTRPIAPHDLQIDWHLPARRVVDLVRAYSPRPAARAILSGVPLKVLRAAVWPETGAPGQILGVRGDALVVAAGEGAVAILELIAPNRGAQSGAEYARRSGELAG